MKNSAKKNKKKPGERKRKNAREQNLQKVIPPTYRLPKETGNMTASLWFSVVNLSLKHAHGIFQTFPLELKANT